MANYEISIFQKIISTRPSFVPNELFGVTDVNIALEKISVLGKTFILTFLYRVFAEKLIKESNPVYTRNWRSHDMNV